MPLPFFLAAIFGKSAAAAITKGVAAKAGAAGGRGLVGHHAHHQLAQQVAKKVGKKVADAGVDAVFSDKDEKVEKS
jgi:predicted naringenin-chalcone synthase